MILPLTFAVDTEWIVGDVTLYDGGKTSVEGAKWFLSADRQRLLMTDGTYVMRATVGESIEVIEVITKDFKTRPERKRTKVGPARNVVQCSHRGEEIRQQHCESCGGRVLLKIYNCDLHAECTIGKQIAGVQCCRRCDDFVIS